MTPNGRCGRGHLVSCTRVACSTCRPDSATSSSIRLTLPRLRASGLRSWGGPSPTRMLTRSSWSASQTASGAMGTRRPSCSSTATIRRSDRTGSTSTSRRRRPTTSSARSTPSWRPAVVTSTSVRATSRGWCWQTPTATSCASWIRVPRTHPRTPWRRWCCPARTQRPSWLLGGGHRSGTTVHPPGVAAPGGARRTARRRAGAAGRLVADPRQEPGAHRRQARGRRRPGGRGRTAGSRRRYARRHRSGRGLVGGHGRSRGQRAVRPQPRLRTILNVPAT